MVDFSIKITVQEIQWIKVYQDRIVEIVKIVLKIEKRKFEKFRRKKNNENISLIL